MDIQTPNPGPKTCPTKRNHPTQTALQPKAQQENVPLSSFSSQPAIQRPSTAFDREPKYSNDSRSLYGRIRSPAITGTTTTTTTRNHCSLEELREADSRKLRLAEEDRRREQQEKRHLEEILAMCAEYERQSTGSLNRSTPEKPSR